MLSVQNVTFSYGESKTLTNLSLNVQQGEYVAIVGESGQKIAFQFHVFYGVIFNDKKPPREGMP